MRGCVWERLDTLRDALALLTRDFVAIYDLAPEDEALIRHLDDADQALASLISALREASDRHCRLTAGARAECDRPTEARRAAEEARGAIDMATFATDLVRSMARVRIEMLSPETRSAAGLP